MECANGMEIQLGKDILLQDFGPIVQNIGEILLKKGNQTIQQIVLESKLQLEQVKHGLLILRQHNLLLLNEKEAKAEKKHIIIEYSIHITFLLARIRFPKYIVLARERYGDEGALILEELLLWGMLTMHQTMEIFKGAIGVPKAFQRMINDSFVSDVSIIDSSQSKDSNLNSNFVLDGNSSSTVFWRVNFTRCDLLIRNEACIELVREKFGVPHSNVIRTAFRVVETSLKEKQENTQSFTLVQFFSMMRGNDDQIAIRYLDEMTTNNPPFMSKTLGREGNSPTYVIHIGTMTKIIKQRIVESSVHHRFGLLSARIFRLLLQRKNLEQKTIATLTLTPVKESRTRLYEMLSANYVSVQELLKNGIRSYWLWYVQLDNVMMMLRSDMLHGLFNARKRWEMHKNEAKLVIEKSLEFPDEISLFPESEQILLSKMRLIHEQLQTSISQLDQTALLLSIN